MTELVDVLSDILEELKEINYTLGHLRDGFENDDSVADVVNELDRLIGEDDNGYYNSLTDVYDKLEDIEDVLSHRGNAEPAE